MKSNWMTAAAAAAEERFRSEGIALTLGGEPTYIPVKPSGPEWSYAAAGPSKLAYARKVAEKLLADSMKGGVVFFCPGKLYPGETNPRWALKILLNRNGKPMFAPSRGRASGATVRGLARAICSSLGVKSHWVNLADPESPDSEILAMPLDHDGESWQSSPWPLAPRYRHLLAAEGPAGLRLPLQHFPEGVVRRVITIEWKGKLPAIFFPPLLQGPFLQLLAAIEAYAAESGLKMPRLQGYVPLDESGKWTVMGIASDPGVLELNLPACASWAEYDKWLKNATAACEAVGLRSWRKRPHHPPEGTGGGNHILWGGATIETNPFFHRPSWLCAILRYWQRHPSLSYLFTGCYVGASSQAPRPDESARDMDDLEMAYRFLEGLPPGDYRQLINETLRHLHTDMTGNTHRSEISFDKFWNVSWPGGAQGLIEFRAVESLPGSRAMSSIALLFSCIAARALDAGRPRPLRDFSGELHDKFFLPTPLWADLSEVLADLRSVGYDLDDSFYREIWEWRFPIMLEHEGLTLRRAHEGWPLLCETPLEGGSTSRFVDTSMHRFELVATEEFAEAHEIHVGGRLLPLRKVKGCDWIAGVKYRRTNLHPSLHPGVPPQIPLHLCVLAKATHRPVAEFVTQGEDFRPAGKASGKLAGPPCRTNRKGDLTYDLRK